MTTTNLEEAKLYTVVYRGCHVQDGYRYALVDFEGQLLAAPICFLFDSIPTSIAETPDCELPEVGTTCQILGMVLSDFGTAKDQLGIEG